MTRDVANWFHEREGELFTIDETPFSRDELVAVVNDSVDPVQQVVAGEDRYYGVIGYQEMIGWYEYTRYDDAIGQVRIGVCAKCVQQARSADEVARTIGESTDTARKKFEKHYSAEHNESPSEIQTGATLLSGTTINGNEAIHVGMDGSGSGVDADTISGDTPSSMLELGEGFTFTAGSQGIILSQFASPSFTPSGIGLDSNDSIWHADFDKFSIYQLNQSGSVLSQFSSPSSRPKGIGLDSSDSLWNGDNNAESIYQLNQSGSILSGFASPSSDPRGIGVDSSDSIWHGDNDANSIYQLNQSGSVVSGFASPSDRPRGIGLDSSDSLWHADLIAESIYQLNQSGSVLSGFASPSRVPTGLGLDSSDSLWNADVSAESIYQLKQSRLIEF